ncbi:hypothetical protein ACFQBQ_03510 [Granulicella cerasi]|uniref:DUF4263 domain-containing protein n=1 Tax=Granulicella cerasi TaxID=741063 RepID=A0ABW1Z5R8_9BACT|nr:hypothetical protein [Granulicella cerasi]
MDLESIVKEIEARARNHEIGRLQSLRKDLKRLTRLPSSSIFTSQTIFAPHYAYHHGGRKELQFNVGFDREGTFRHGVAFSFEPSQTLPYPEEQLLPSVRRFNEYIALNAKLFADMSMWDWQREHRRDSDRPVSPILPDLVQRHVFVFLGKMQPIDAIDVDLIVFDLDRLIPLYLYVEGEGDYADPNNGEKTPFVPGCTVKKRSTSSSLAARTLDVDLRHNALQRSLYTLLEAQHGHGSVATEWKSGAGKIDVAVRRPDGKLWIYEIKTSLSARGCIREGLSQILEYAYWPGAIEPERLFIVGEPEFDREARAYVALLQRQFKLPIEYQQHVLLESE